MIPQRSNLGRMLTFLVHARYQAAWPFTPAARSRSLPPLLFSTNSSFCRHKMLLPKKEGCCIIYSRVGSNSNSSSNAFFHSRRRMWCWRNVKIKCTPLSPWGERFRLPRFLHQWITPPVNSSKRASQHIQAYESTGCTFETRIWASYATTTATISMS